MESFIRDALKRGIEAFQAGKIKDARAYFSDILDAQPMNADANHNMGILELSNNRAAQAVAFLKAAVEVSPDKDQYWISYISALIKANNIDEAKIILNLAKKRGVNTASLIQLEKDNFVSPPQFFSLAGRPANYQLQMLTDVFQQGKFQTVLRLSDPIAAELNRSEVFQNIRGAAYAALMEPAKAKACFQKALEINPQNIDALNNKGNILFSANELDQAIACFEQAIDINPRYAEAHFNLGRAYCAKGEFYSAIKSHTRALKIRPDFVDALNSKGTALKELGELDVAIDSFQRAIELKEDFCDAFYNLGTVHAQKGDFDSAEICFKKAINIGGESPDILNNLGMALFCKGHLGEATKSYLKALELDRDYLPALRNLLFPLKINKLHNDREGDWLNILLGNYESNPRKLETAILNYRVHEGGPRAKMMLENVVELFAELCPTRISNPLEPTAKESLEIKLPEYFVSLLYFGRSGTGLLHSLIDGHSQISTLPSVYFSEFFDVRTWNKITAGGWEEMADRFIALYKVLFDAGAPNPVPTRGGCATPFLGRNEGMTAVGGNKHEKLIVEELEFKKELNLLMNSFESLDAAAFFKLVHKAYEKAIGNTQQKKLIFYHIHNPDDYAQLNVVASSQKNKWILMVREPIQNLEATLRQCLINSDYIDVASRIVRLLFQFDQATFSKQDSVGVRLEDLKSHPKRTLRAICKWMRVEEEQCLYEMTAQGKKWWGDPSSPDYGTKSSDPFEKSSVARQVGSILSDNDQRVFRTLFYPFSVRFCYVKEDLDQFKTDLKVVRPMLDNMFDFERRLYASGTNENDNLVSSGWFLYLRKCMVERWNVLDQFHTYPNIVEPLSI